MAHQSTSIPTINTRNEPISWPTPEETTPRALPPRTAAAVNDIYRSSLCGAKRSFRAMQGKISSTATSLARSVRHFADERPLHFVGVVAGIALIGGVALRIWRSNRDA